MTEGFESYARANYLPALERPEPDPDTLMAAVSYVATRRVEGQESRLLEVLTSRERGPAEKKREIDRACLTALLATSRDLAGLARFLAVAWTDRHPSSTRRLFEEALRELGPVSHEAILRELSERAGREGGGQTLKQLGQLLVRLSGTRPSESIGVFVRAEPARRLAIVEAWRGTLARAGLLPPPEPDAEPEPEAEPASAPP